MKRSSTAGNPSPPFWPLPSIGRAQEADGRVELLRLVGVQELDERLGNLSDAVLVDVLVDDRNRVLDQDRRRRDHHLVLESGLLSGEDLVLVGDRDVTVAGLEVLDRVTCGLVEHGHVAEDALAAAPAHRPRRPPRCRRSRASLRRRRRRCSSELHRSMPGRASGPRDRSCARSSKSSIPSGLPGRTSKTTSELETMPLSASGRPVVRDQSGVGDHVDVGAERERHDVGLEPVDDVLRLGRRAAVGLLEDDLLVVVLFLPLRPGRPG